MIETPESPGADAWRRVWRTFLPHGTRRAGLAFAPSGERVAAGTVSIAGFGHSAGSLTMFNARTGVVVRQIVDDWQVHVLAFSPDSRFLVTSESRTHVGGPDERRVRILNAETLDERCRYNEVLHGGWSFDLAFSRDGDWVAGRTDRFRDLAPTAYVFDATTGTRRWRRELPGRPDITCLVLAPDSESVAASYGERDEFGWPVRVGGVAVLDTMTGAERLRIMTTPTRVSSLAYSPDSRSIVAGCDDGTIRVFDAASGSVQMTVHHAASSLAGPATTHVASVAVSDDAAWVAANSAALDPQGDIVGLVGIYDLLQGRQRFPPVRVGFSGQVGYSPTLRHVIVNARYGWLDYLHPDALHSELGLTVIDARTGRRHSSSSGASSKLSFAIAPDGGSIAALATVPREVGPEDGCVEMYNLGTEVSRSEVGTSIAEIAMSPAGMPLVAVADTSAAVTVIAAESGTRLARQPIPGGVAAMVFADHGQAVVSGGGNGVRLFSIAGDRSWELASIGTVNALAVAGATGAWIATAAGRTVRLLSSVDGQSRWPNPNTHPQTVTRIAFSADGDWIATGCRDRETRILDALTGAETFSIRGSGIVHALAFSPSGALLATANEDGKVVLVDAATTSERSRISRLIACSRIAFSSDGALLATAWDDNIISIFDVTSGSAPQEVRRLAFPSPISDLAFNPADHTVAVATGEGSVGVYDAHDGIELVRILQPASVSHLAFSADGAVLATAGDDGIVRVWASGSPASV